MRKLLEIELADEVKKSQFIQFAVSLLTIALFLLVRTFEKSYFNLSFYFECAAILILLKYYNKAQRNKNYAFWGFSIAIGLYVVHKLIYFTFFEYQILIVYFSMLAGLFLLLNAFIMSSPLYYPRVPWWEYDFRYRAELKGEGHFSGLSFPLRLSDLRRGSASLAIFETLPLGGKMKIDIIFNEKVYKLNGTIKTLREVIPGRPIVYGIVLEQKSPEARAELIELKKLWNKKKSANLRQKFQEMKVEVEAK